MKIYKVSVEIPAVDSYQHGSDSMEWDVYARFFSTVEGAEKFATRFRDTPYLRHKNEFISLRDKKDHPWWSEYYYDPHDTNIEIEAFEIDNFLIFSKDDIVEWDIG